MPGEPVAVECGFAEVNATRLDYESAGSGEPLVLLHGFRLAPDPPPARQLALTTSPIPYGYRAFEIDLDFVDHQLRVAASDGALRTLPPAPRSVADFYQGLKAMLRALGLEARIRMSPTSPFARAPTRPRPTSPTGTAPPSNARHWRVDRRPGDR